MPWWMIRLGTMSLSLVLLCTITFFMIRFAPGGPFSLERDLDPQVIEAMEAKYRLDRSLPEQYLFFWWDLLHGDLGPSMKHKARDVSEIIHEHLPKSMLLGSLAMVIALLLGVGAGLGAALGHRRSPDLILMILAVAGLSLPSFVIGPLLQWEFAIRQSWFPIAGYGGWAEPLTLVLPSLTLSLPFAARIARLTRSGLLETLQMDHIRMARAKGLSEFRVVVVHALPGALLPVASYLGPALAGITTGTLVVERIFSIPGLGREFVESALNRDYTLVMGTVLVYGIFLVVLNLLSDLLAAWISPRLREMR